MRIYNFRDKPIYAHFGGQFVQLYPGKGKALGTLLLICLLNNGALLVYVYHHRRRRRRRHPHHHQTYLQTLATPPA